MHRIPLRRLAAAAGLLLAALLLGATFPGFAPEGLAPAPVRAERPRIVETISLPEPSHSGPMSLEEALAKRRSQRRFAKNRMLSLGEIGQLLWAAQGQNRPGKRTAPSAGGLYPLELYAVTRKGIYHYRSVGHEALFVWQAGMLDSLHAVLGGDRDYIRHAGAVFVITGVVDRTAERYGRRALRYVTLEAGHAAQNLLLQATALGLGSVPLGAFPDDQLRRVLDLPTEQTPFYLVPVGFPP